MKKIIFYVLTALLSGTGLAGCSSRITPQKVAGTYRAYFKSKGGPLAFPLHITLKGDSLQAYVVNGADTSHFNQVRLQGDSLQLGFTFYNSYIHAKVKNGHRLTGTWHKRSISMPFHAKKNGGPRYKLTGSKTYHFDGHWPTIFTSKNDTFPAFGKFVSQPNGVLHGTFETETGDYRFLKGVHTDSTFTMSTFDGAHAFLFKARLHPDSTITGDFWSADSYHARWQAHKGKNNLRNPMKISAGEAVGEKVRFSFYNLSGDKVSASDPQFAGKPMLIYLFGSWCPNCADETRMLRKLYRKNYKNSDLKIVGLAFEYAGNFGKQAEMVHRYKKRFSIPWSLLIADNSQKDKAVDSLPFLKDIVSFPTSIFVDKNHVIRAVHTGFNGPATGHAYYQEIERFNKNINDIL